MPVRKLSLGQRMRAEIAASLLHEPRVVFLDEPTIGLDVVARHELRDLIQEWNREQGVTVLLTSHDAGDIEGVAKRVIVINGQGPAPKAANPQLFAGKDAIPGNGPLGATVPAAVDSAAIALAKYGTKSLSDVLQPAIELADGFPMYEFLHHYFETERKACEPYACPPAG